jgi:DNA excision repair protein ERCC-6
MSNSREAPFIAESAEDPKSSMTLLQKDGDTIAEAAAVVAGATFSNSSDHSQPDSPKDEASILKDLTEGVRNQDDIQRDITNQAELVLIEKEDENDQKRIDKVNANKNKLVAQKRTHQRQLDTAGLNQQIRLRAKVQLDRLDSEIAAFDQDIIDIQQRIDQRHQTPNEEDEKEQQHGGNKRMQHESQRDFLIRTGKITPFARMPEVEVDGLEGELAEALMDVEQELEMEDTTGGDTGPKSHQNLRVPGFAEMDSGASISAPEEEFSLRPRKKRRLPNGSALSSARVSDDGDYDESHVSNVSYDEASPGSPTTDFDDTDLAALLDEDDNGVIGVKKKKLSKSKGNKTPADQIEDLTGIDDGDEAMYQSRLQSWVERRSRARLNKQKQAGTKDNEPNENEIAEPDVEEWFKPSPDEPDHQYENGLKLPGDIYPALFDYQKTGVQWLGELYSQQVGGIIGDEMGLGKTIQIISFLAGLHYSKKLTQPVIVVAPATVLRQWVNEFHRWWPPLRVSILHTSGSGMLNKREESRIEDDEESFHYRRDSARRAPKSSKAAKRVVDRVIQQGHVLVTTYAGLQTYSDLIIPVKWGYAVLDEGHKIRNPNTAITIHCKELQTANRVILSGTPMQNNLVELWSLLDFVYPMRLGTLVNFRNQFEIPIKIGGYASATNLQIMTATKCAETLKEAIGPYLLQRVKADVASDLPKKSEQVLFCKLTKPQRDAYELFLKSDEMTSILNRSRQSLYGIDILRKICNHPDLLDPTLRNKPGYKWGNPNKSGKMQVVKALLEMWKKKGDKILLFSQGVQMLNIIEDYVKSLDGFRYLRMDGTTAIKDRQSMVDNFNNDPELNVFLLTTKVGGLGVNLTGANRVIIFDPDWNPSTDVQARERAWRLGQKKEVTIYRLMTAGTIEEKIYHRQIFKQFLADKILKDPKQRQTFHMRDLYDLFTLGASDGSTETGELFKGSELQLIKPPEPIEETTPIPHHNGWGDSASLPRMKPVSDNTPWGGLPPSVPEESEASTAPAKAVEGLVADDGEVRKITGVAALEEYRGDPSENKLSTEEDRIMEGIFARSGVHSVLEHDQIVNGKRVIKADRGMLEREAKKIAAEAAAELRKAGEAARHIQPGTVTWTGEVGEAGRPVTPPSMRRWRGGGNAGPNSASILSSLSARQGLGSSSAGNSRAGTPVQETGPQGKDFLKLIRDYIRRQGGSVPSQSLVVHFNHMCKSDRQTEAFKACLKQVAVLKPGVNGRMRGRWELIEDFK